MTKLALLILLVMLPACEMEVSHKANTPQLVQVKVVAHMPFSEVGSGMSSRTQYECWVYEDTTTKERLLSTSKYGEIGETFRVSKDVLSPK